MPPSRRPFLADEELGRKDDDHWSQTNPGHRWHPKQWKPPRRRRILLGIVISYLLYIFFKNMPTGLPRDPTRIRLYNPPVQNQHSIPDQGIPPPRSNPTADDKDGFYYEGKIYFNRLGRTLKTFRSQLDRPSTATVFAAASLKSVSDLLPLACEMTGQKLNEVHFVLMGRDDVSIEGIGRVNGIDSMGCPINWHDARADYAPWSTDNRMQRAVAGALPYLQTYLRPQVIITQGESLEYSFFLNGMQRAQDLEVPHISLPRPSRDLMWISTLTSNALRVWEDIHVEFLIYANPDSAGSLIRLIQSLKNADYLGKVPSLTLELPHKVDPELLRFLKSLDWPPQASNKVTIRRRVQHHDMDPVEASLKAVEAFYPKDPELSHVLVLSPHVELAPSFYHYLMHTMLKYKHSNKTSPSSKGLFGISLDLPSARLTTNEPFKRLDIDATQFSTHNNPNTLPLFLWQAPNSNAALYFGEKWAELHTFLSHRLSTQESDHEKVVSRRFPAMMEYFLEFIRARGYYLLYPAFPSKGKFSLATFHDDLYRFPEEFTKDMASTPPAEALEDAEQVESLLSRSPTVMSLLERFSLSLPEISHLPKLSYRGEEMSDLVFSRDTSDYLRKFRVRYGGCPDEPLDEANDEDSMVREELFCVDE